MNAFLLLLGQIFIITVIQLSIEVFLDPDKHKFQMLIINAACFLGCLFLLLDFVFNNLINNLNMVISLPYF
jgi:hypothetical protein